MDRDIPVFNKIIMNKIHQKNMEIHYKNLINIRKSKKSKMSSTSTSFYKPNSKTYQIEEQKKTEIDKNNIILFQKINNIVSRGNGTNNNLSRKLSSKKEIRQFDKIYQENKKLVDRLSSLKPTINNKKLFQQRKKELNILKFICKYSPNKHDAQIKMSGLKHTYKIGKFYDGNNARNYRVKTQNFKDQQGQALGMDKSWNMSMAIRPDYCKYNKLKQSPKAAGQNIQSSLTKYQIEPKLQNKCINLYKCIKRIDSSSFSLSIIRTHHNYEIIAEQMCQDGRHFKIVLEQQKGQSILQYIDYDYERLIQNLIIEDDQLTIPQELAVVKKQVKAKLTPKPNKKKISQMILPSHITQLNEDQLNLQRQDDIGNDNHNQSSYISSSDQSIMNTFLSFRGNS